MIKTYKVMLLPNNKQNTKMFQTAGSARYAYNWTVARQMESLEQTGLYLSESDIRKEFTIHKQDNQWLYDISNNATKQSVRDCCDAFINFSKSKNKVGYVPYNKKQISKAMKDDCRLTRYEMNGHPKFKKKGICTPSFYIDTDKIQITDTHVKLEKIADSTRKNRAKANWIKLAEKNRIPTDVKYYNPRVAFDGIHWWFSVGVEVYEQITPASNKGIGIDVGIKDLAVCSNSTVYENINKTKEVKRLKKKKRRLQRSISRKYIKNKEGESYCKTNNIVKSEKELLKLNHRLTDIRHNHIHQVTTEIIKQKPSFIVTEDLNVKGMMKNKHLSQAIQEQCLAEFISLIEYKSYWNGIEYIRADRYYPSSKLCHICKTVKEDLMLKDRTYKCEYCKNTIDRDLQATLNLRDY